MIIACMHTIFCFYMYSGACCVTVLLEVLYCASEHANM